MIEEHRPDWSIQRCYLQGAHQNEMVAAFDGGVYTNEWFWQDGRGNTSHITGDNAALLERYTYDLGGAPKFYDEWGNERFGGSVYDARFLFAGSQYLPETGLYDMRNRFYSPVLNRFLQTDPIGFAGDALNLYRYCGDDPVDRSDPMGLVDNSGLGPYSPLTSFGGGDWIKGSDGLSAWDWNHKPQAGMDGGGGGLAENAATPIPRKQDLNARLRLGGNATEPMGSSSHYTDEKLRNDQGPAAGLTTQDLIPSKDGSVTLRVDLKVRRDLATKDPQLLKREWQHVDAWRIWVGRMNSILGSQFSGFPTNRQGADAIKALLTNPQKNYFQNEIGQQNSDFHRKGGPRDIDYGLKE